MKDRMGEGGGNLRRAIQLGFVVCPRLFVDLFLRFNDLSLTCSISSKVSIINA